jgi:hypothetical protein
VVCAEYQKYFQDNHFSKEFCQLKIIFDKKYNNFWTFHNTLYLMEVKTDIVYDRVAGRQALNHLSMDNYPKPIPFEKLFHCLFLHQP